MSASARLKLTMLDQAAIMFCGIASIWLSQSPRLGSRKWACVIGLVAQPFWIVMCWRLELWGVMALTAAYTAAWLRGIRTYWLAR